MYAKNIKLFKIDGEFASDKNIQRTREEMESVLYIRMQDGGYSPILDLGSGFFTEYNVEKDSYNFLVTMYGMYVGKRKARECQGYYMGKPLPLPKSEKLCSR